MSEYSQRDWDIYFFDLLAVIKTKSKDKSTKVGALVVGEDHEIRSTGFNSFPRGLDDNIPERHKRPEKYYWIEHAERNAIYNAARVGTPLKNCSIYIIAFPCTDCCRGIIQSGIREIVIDVRGGVDEMMKNWARWKASMARSYFMSAECGVNIRLFCDDPMGARKRFHEMFLGEM